MVGCSFFSLDRTKVRAFVRRSKCEADLGVAGGFIEPAVVGCSNAIWFEGVAIEHTVEGGEANIPTERVLSIDLAANQCADRAILVGAFDHPYFPELSGTWVFQLVGYGALNLLNLRSCHRHKFPLSNWSHACAQRKHRSSHHCENLLHLNPSLNPNPRHHRVRLRGCQHPRPAGTSAFRAGLGHTARGRGRPHLSAPFTSLLDCGRHHAGVARIFPVVRGGAS